MTKNNTISFPTIIDNTIRSTFVSCPKQAYWRFFRHLSVPTISVHLHAGGAFARGIEITRREFYGNKLSEEVAIGRGLLALTQFWSDYPAEPLEGHKPSVKSYYRMAGALEYYFSQYPMQSDKIRPYMHNNQPACEFNFLIPLPINHPETGEPLLYSGRFDLLGIYQDGLWVIDEKTTKQLGPSWRDQWKLRSQFTGYCWGAREYGHAVKGFIIRGISILADSYGTIEAIGYRPDHMINTWYTQLLRDITRMVECWKTNYFDYNLADACSSYGGCMFNSLCSSQHPEVWTNQYVEQKWDPVHVF